MAWWGILLVSLTGCFLGVLGGTAIGEFFLLKAFEVKIKRTVKKCREEWQRDTRILERIYGDVDNYIENKVDKIIYESELVEKRRDF